MYVRPVQANCQSPDLQLKSDLHVYTENANFAKEKKHSGAIRGELRCQQDINQNSGIVLDIGGRYDTSNAKMDASFKEAYIYKNFGWKNLNILTGFHDVPVGYMEAYSADDVLVRRDFRDSISDFKRESSAMAMVK